MRCTPRPVSTAGEGQGGRLTRRLTRVPSLGWGCSGSTRSLPLPAADAQPPASLAISLSESLKSSGESQKVTAPRAGLGVGRAWTSETSGPLQLSSPEPGPELRTPITAEPS